MWSLPELPEIGLRSLVMSDGPIGVRGTRWTADDPSVALPSPTALAATWDPELARTAGVLLAQEARRKGVHVLLAPTGSTCRAQRWKWSSNSRAESSRSGTSPRVRGLL
jgi:beta-glucosidase